MWHRNSGEDNRQHWGSALWIIIAIAIAVAVFSGGRGWGWGWWWLIFLVPCFLGPRLWRSMRGGNDDGGDKPKNDFDFEKPKRSFTREDGEEFEIIDEDPQPRTRRNPPDDIEYV